MDEDIVMTESAMGRERSDDRGYRSRGRGFGQDRANGHSRYQVRLGEHTVPADRRHVSRAEPQDAIFRPSHTESSTSRWTHDRFPGGAAGRKPREYSRNERFTETTRQGRLYISNLHYEQTQEDLTRLFKPFGNFSGAPFIRYDKSDRPTGEAEITFLHLEDAEAACDSMQGKEVSEQVLQLKVAPVMPPRRQSDRHGFASRLDSDIRGNRRLDTRPSPYSAQLGRRGYDRNTRARPTQDDLDRELDQCMQQSR